MYQVGDKVMHKQEGACFIKSVVSMKMGTELKDYFLLEPLLNAKTSVYVSINSDKQENIRPVIDVEELQTALLEATDSPLEWVDNPKLRLLNYTKVMAMFRFQDTLQTMGCLLLQNDRKKLSAKDELFLVTVKKLIYSEIAIVKNIDYAKIAANPEKYMTA